MLFSSRFDSKYPSHLNLDRDQQQSTERATALRPTVLQNRSNGGHTDAKVNALDAKKSWTQTITEVNVLQLSSTVLQNFEQGSGPGLLILEDLAQRGELSVFPRRVIDDVPPQQEEQWSFETSSFRDYSRDTDALSCECFDHDWNLSKLRIFR